MWFRNSEKAEMYVRYQLTMVDPELLKRIIYRLAPAVSEDEKWHDMEEGIIEALGEYVWYHSDEELEEEGRMYNVMSDGAADWQIDAYRDSLLPELA